MKNTISEKITKASNDAKNILKKLFMMNYLCKSKIKIFGAFKFYI